MSASLSVNTTALPVFPLLSRFEAVSAAPSGLDSLQPMPLLPSHPIRRRIRPEDALKRIQALRVEKSKHQVHGAMYVVNAVYTIKTYYHEAQSHMPSRIPVHGRFGNATKQSLESSKPSAVIHVSLGTFLQLRYDAYEIAKSSHEDGHSCAFVNV